MQTDINQTLDLMRAALHKSNGINADTLAKAFSQSASATTGLTAYDLEAPAKTLYPVLTPLRNMIPRVGGGTGIQANWRAVTKVNSGNMQAGVGEGKRSGVIDQEVKEYLAAYRTIGLENYVTFEAELAGQGFDDVKARATRMTLEATMLQEEKIILGGNTSLALGTTPTPTLATFTTGGTLADSTTYSVICVALTLFGYQVSSVANGVYAQIVRNNADGTTDTYGAGSAQKSANATQATGGAGNAHTISATVAAVRGAVAYAWYLGTVGNERLTAITTTPCVLLAALNGSGQLASALPASDNSTNDLVYDGLLTMAAKSSLNAYWKVLAGTSDGLGTGLTADGSGGISEIDAALQSLWDNHKVSPDTIWISSQEAGWMRKKILNGSSTAAQRFVFNVNQLGVMGGGQVQGYINPFTMGTAQQIPIKVHPDMPAGTILMTSSTLPYPLSGVSDVFRIRTRKEYFQIEWPLRTRKYEYGVYADEVLQHYAPFTMAMISGIAAK